MSDPTHHAQPKGEHGTIMNYVIGFASSLVFTAIPYYLVTHEKLSGTTLQTTILSVAVAQMLIQIFFFLHLGRGPKPFYNVVFFVATVGLILVVVGGSIFIMNHLHYNMAPSEVSKNLAEDEAISQIGGVKTGACQQIYENHQIIISSSGMTPTHVEARMCDTLTFINEDSQGHEITFATPTTIYGSYAGRDKLQVRKGRPKTITLNQAGTYPLHDPLNPQIKADFTVAP